MLAALVGCADANSKGGGGRETPRVTSIAISPTSATLLTGATQKFDVTVFGTGISLPSSRLFVNGVEGGDDVVGHVDVTGLYAAPSMVPATNPVTLVARSTDDPSREASAAISLQAPPGLVTIDLSPASVDVQHGAIVQFIATLHGVQDTRLRWTLDLTDVFSYGSVDTHGSYVAPMSGYCHDRVTAISLADPSVQASASVRCIPEAPSITSISPDDAAIGDAIHIQGTGFYPPGVDDLRVMFPGLDGVPIAVTAPTYMRDRNQIWIKVPYGAASGNVFVECDYPNAGTLRSNAVAFTRTPRIRLMPAANELATGDQTTIHARVIGAPAASLSWTAISGSMSSDGTYSAPANLSSETIDSITACISGTSNCQTTHVRVHPLLVTPFRGTVPLVGTLQLGARGGGAAASWQLWGPGALDAHGLYTASAGGGPIAIQASSSAAAETAWLGVTGGNPGEIGRIYDIPDPSTFIADFSVSLTAAGNRMYSLTSVREALYNHNVLDVYDISVVTAPVWVDSIEPVLAPTMWIDGDRLFMATGSNLQNDGRPAIAVYDLTGDKPTLTRYDRPSDPFYPGLSRDRNRVFWCIPPGPTGPTVPCGEYDADTAVRRDYAIPVPPAVTFASMSGMIRVGDLAYVVLTYDRVNADYHLVTVDVSGPTAVIVDDKNLPNPAPGVVSQSPTPSVRWPLLIAGASVFDISGRVPVRQSVLSSPQIVDWSGNRVAGIGPDGAEIRVFDLTDPKLPVLVNVLPEDSRVAQIVGDNLVVASGMSGTSFERIADPGGFTERQMTGDDQCAVLDQAIDGTILYSAEDCGAGYLLVSDVTTQPPTFLTRLSFGTYGREHPQAVYAEGTHVVVATDRSLWFLEATSPGNPTLVTSLDVPGVTIRRVGDWLYVGSVRKDGLPSLAIVNVANFNQPVVFDQAVMPAVPMRIAAAGALLYAAADSGGLLIVDTSMWPVRLVTQWKPAQYVEDITIDGTTAYLAAADDGLLVADLSAPDAPVLVSQTPMPSVRGWLAAPTEPRIGALSVAPRRGLVYVGALRAGRVFVFDCSNPAHPRLVGRTRVSGPGYSSFVGSFAFAGDEVFYAGLNDDGFSSTFPGVEANDASPRNVILLYPAELDSMVAPTPSAAAAAMHPKLQPAVAGTEHGWRSRLQSPSGRALPSSRVVPPPS